MNDVTWIGSRLLPGPRAASTIRIARADQRDAWPYDDTRDAGLAEVSPGGGYPTCRPVVADSGGTGCAIVC